MCAHACSWCNLFPFDDVRYVRRINSPNSERPAFNPAPLTPTTEGDTHTRPQSGWVCICSMYITRFAPGRQLEMKWQKEMALLLDTFRCMQSVLCLLFTRLLPVQTERNTRATYVYSGRCLACCVRVGRSPLRRVGCMCVNDVLE